MKKILPVLAALTLFGAGCVGNVKTAVKTAQDIKRVADDVDKEVERVSRDSDDDAAQKPEKKKPCPLPIEVVRARCAIPETVHLETHGYDAKTGEVRSSLVSWNSCGATSKVTSTEKYAVPLRLEEPIVSLYPAAGASRDFWKDEAATNESLKQRAIDKAQGRSGLYRATVKMTEIPGLGDYAFIADTPLTVNKNNAGLTDPGFILWARVGDQYGYLDSGGADYQTGTQSFGSPEGVYRSVGGGCSKEEVQSLAKDVLIPRLEAAGRDFAADLAEWNAADDVAEGKKICAELKSSSGDPVFTTADAHTIFNNDWNYFRITALNPASAFFDICEYTVTRGPFLTDAPTIEVRGGQLKTSFDEYLKSERYEIKEDLPGIADRAVISTGRTLLVQKGSTVVVLKCGQGKWCSVDDLKRVAGVIGPRLR